MAARSVFGRTTAIAARGTFAISKMFTAQIEAGTPRYVPIGFAVYYGTYHPLN